MNVKILAEEISQQLPIHIKPPAIPLQVWERLRYNINRETDEIQILYVTTAIEPEVWASLDGEYVRNLDPEINAAAILVRKLRHHYLMVHKPELLVC